MPTATPKMPSAVPCDGNWYKIYTSGAGGAFAQVFLQFTGAVCTFTARLIDDPPAAAPGAAPAQPVVKKEMVIPAAGGWRGLAAFFEHFEVKCEPPAGAGEHHPEHPQHPEPPPGVQTTRKGAPAGGALQDCPFEWYMMV